MTTMLKLKKSIVLVLSTVLISLFFLLSGFVYSEKTVTVIADGQAHTLHTHQVSMYTIVEEAGVTLNPEDALVLDTKTLKDGTTITVKRAIPVTVQVGNYTRTLMTTAKTAQELANKIGFARPYYAVVGDRNQVLTKNGTVRIGKVSNRYEQTVTKSIGIETVREPDPTMEKGQEKVVQYGTPGTAEVREEILEDSNHTVIARNILQSTVTKKMEPRIVREGTREQTVSTSRGAMRYSRVLTMHATAYTPADGGGDGITASGIRATRGVVAVDPRVIPLGTRLYIPGYGEAIAADTGGAIKGNRIDLVMESYSEAMNFGRQNVEVYVLQ